MTDVDNVDAQPDAAGDLIDARLAGYVTKNWRVFWIMAKRLH